VNIGKWRVLLSSNFFKIGAPLLTLRAALAGRLHCIPPLQPTLTRTDG